MIENANFLQEEYSRLEAVEEFSSSISSYDDICSDKNIKNAEIQEEEKKQQRTYAKSSSNCSKKS